MSGHRFFEDWNNAGRTDRALDPGDTATIPGNSVGHMPLVSGGAETRTLGVPTSVGQRLVLYMRTDGGDITLTYSPTLNLTGNNTVTFANVGDTIELESVQTADTTFVWRAMGGDAALTTV